MARAFVVEYEVHRGREVPYLSPEAIAAAADEVADLLSSEAYQRWPEAVIDITAAGPLVGPDSAEPFTPRRRAGEIDIDSEVPVAGTERPEIIAELEQLEDRLWWTAIDWVYVEGLEALDRVPLRCSKCGGRLWIEGEASRRFNLVDPWGTHTPPNRPAGLWLASTEGPRLDCPFCRASRGGQYPLEWDRDASGPLPAPGPSLQPVKAG